MFKSTWYWIWFTTGFPVQPPQELPLPGCGALSPFFPPLSTGPSQLSLLFHLPMPHSLCSLGFNLSYSSHLQVLPACNFHSVVPGGPQFKQSPHKIYILLCPQPSPPVHFCDCVSIPVEPFRNLGGLHGSSSRSAAFPQPSCNA